jgi:hypothetical protein
MFTIGTSIASILTALAGTLLFPALLALLYVTCILFSGLEYHGYPIEFSDPREPIISELLRIRKLFYLKFLAT